MPTHEVTYKTTQVPVDLPAGATVREVSRYPLVFERRGNTVEVFDVPANEATVSNGIAAAIHVNGSCFEITVDQGAALIHELIQLVTARRRERDAAQRQERRRAELATVNQAQRRLQSMLTNLETPPRRW